MKALGPSSARVHQPRGRGSSTSTNSPEDNFKAIAALCSMSSRTLKERHHLHLGRRLVLDYLVKSPTP